MIATCLFACFLGAPAKIDNAKVTLTIIVVDKKKNPVQDETVQVHLQKQPCEDESLPEAEDLTGEDGKAEFVLQRSKIKQRVYITFPDTSTQCAPYKIVQDPDQVKFRLIEKSVETQFVPQCVRVCRPRRFAIAKLLLGPCRCKCECQCIQNSYTIPASAELLADNSNPDDVKLTLLVHRE